MANFPLWTRHTVSVLVWSALFFLELFTLKMRFSFLFCTFLTFTLSVHPFRNWCPHTVTKTVTCQVQNGTILQRVYQTCRWPQGCTGGRWGGEGSLLPLYHWDVKDLKRGTPLKLKTTTVEVPRFLFGIMFVCFSWLNYSGVQSTVVTPLYSVISVVVANSISIEDRTWINATSCHASSSVLQVVISNLTDAC